MQKFKQGQVFLTKRINNAIDDNEQFARDYMRAVQMYTQADFSDMEHQEDIESNYEAIKTGDDRIFATYNTCEGKIYIITEFDRSATTILFTDEY